MAERFRALDLCSDGRVVMDSNPGRDRGACVPEQDT